MKNNPLMVQFIRGVSQLHVALYKLSGGFGGAMLGVGRNTLILTTRGRKTGRETSTPLLYLEDEGKLYIVASFGGSDTAPGWYLNLKANPAVSAQVGGLSATYRTRTLEPSERERIWPRLVSLYPSYATYQQRTTRNIPVVELTRVVG